ncbi:MAG: 2-oxoacid:acceptor oxidoreductase family protein [Acidobacteriota bacterium]|jgi:2-oxoglutarate ferredoxin oxidoreductase subunit gamma|nr:2-oxoacid:acceptor oxidoreductase family protein [Acidobacteriota bacterium]
MARTEIRIGGFGGQGVILTGYVIGKAAAIFDKKNATMTQSFGPEARGSACSSQVILSDQAILYPYIKTPQVMVFMSQEAFTKYSPSIDPNGMALIEEDLVDVKGLPPTVKVFGIPATRIAEELGRKVVLNMVVTGFFTAVTGLVSKEAMRKAIETSVPKGTEGLNLMAFEKGYEYGLQKKSA